MYAALVVAVVASIIGLCGSISAFGAAEWWRESAVVFGFIGDLVSFVGGHSAYTNGYGGRRVFCGGQSFGGVGVGAVYRTRARDGGIAMVDSAGSFSQNGLRDWLMQRFSAVVIALYVIYLLLFVTLHHNITFGQWHALFAAPFMRIFSTLVLLAILVHGWIGLWTVLTDYVKVTWLRLCLVALLIISLLLYVIWGIWVIW